MKIIKQSLLTIFTIIFIGSFFTNNIHAQQNFTVDSDVFYKLNSKGTAKVIHTIKIVNNDQSVFASSYKLNLMHTDPVNPKVYEGETNLEFTETAIEGGTQIQTNFDKGVVGVSGTREFVVEYDVDGFADRTGEVWEISIPKLESPNDYGEFNVRVEIPKELGLEAYISPEPIEKIQTDQNYLYTFDKGLMVGGVSAGFGQFQFFTFELKYHLENPLAKHAEIEIAIPPDTSLQKMYYSSIEPIPEDLRVDSDGNWLIKYTLNPRQRVDILVSGDVQIFASPRKLFELDNEKYVKNIAPTKHWQSDDEEIISIAKNLKTPDKIYDYVINTLIYDYSRVRPNIERLGAKAAQENPNSAICMEFTDLFVALARAAGIPAREINGYAHTTNPKIQPLSLVADVLHSWPEYYDLKSKTWIPVDPTWGSTAQGEDYFNKLDLRHFAFVIHGENSETPYSPGSYKLGPNPQKDVFVNFGQVPEEKNARTEIFAQIVSKVPLISKQVVARIKNTGPVALYDLSPEIKFDNVTVKSDLVKVLPPYSTYNFKVEIPFSIFAKNTPTDVKIVSLGSEVLLKTNKSSIVFQNVLVFFIILLTILVIILGRLGKLGFLGKLLGSLTNPCKKLIRNIKNQFLKIFIR